MSFPAVEDAENGPRIRLMTPTEGPHRANSAVRASRTTRKTKHPSLGLWFRVRMMIGPFASAALELFGHGLAPIPLNGKVPLVKHKNRQPFSRDTLEKFTTRQPSANVGILTGPSKLTVVDIDDPAQLKPMLARFGETPLQVETPSGGFHLYYRSSGERSTNLRSEGLEVDIKAGGGLIVVPPSIRSEDPNKGKPYRFLKGDWSEIPNLPAIHPGSLSSGTTTKQPPSSHRVPKGKRNNFLFDQLRREVRYCDNIEALQDVAKTIVADQLEYNPRHPITEAEINRVVHSVWKMGLEGRNWIRPAPSVRHTKADIDMLGPFPDALSLFSTLSIAHGARGEPFCVSPKGMAKGNLIHGFGRKRYEKARDALLEFGYLIQVHHGGSRPGDASTFILATPPHIRPIS